MALFVYVGINLLICRFLNLFLLPRIRDDIAEYKKLNFHLYQVGSVSTVVV